MLRMIIGAAAGAAIGFAVGFLLKRGNSEGGSPMMSTSPFISAGMGAMIGMILATGM